jgi:hypothetical protein
MTVATTATLRARAAEAVRIIARGLRDPETVVATTTASAEIYAAVAGDQRTALWQPLSLNDGYPAIALLFAELACEDDHQRQYTYAHLSAARHTTTTPRYLGLYGGPAAFAFAAHCAGTATGDFAGLSGQLDRLVLAQASAVVTAVSATVRASQPVGLWNRYDVVNGASGLGRLLLARHTSTGSVATHAALNAILVNMASVATMEHVDGAMNSPWWTVNPVRTWPEGQGHVNLGLAHGIPGPLVLLALAWQAGVRVPRHEAAIERVIETLLLFRHDDRFGPYWPHAVTVDVDGSPMFAPPIRTRDAWCYGALGVARAIHLAGRALARPEWTELGLAAARAVVQSTGHEHVTEFSLCHGWAGLLRITERLAAESGDPVLSDAIDVLAERVLDGFDPASPFGYRYGATRDQVGIDRPGFLEGAAGIALALHCFASGKQPTTDWDAGLLIA